MPVTARLSRRFYEKFGDEIVNELVEWLNQVDVAYRSELRELNEVNFTRFDAKLEQRLAQLRSELVVEIHATRADVIKWMFLFWAGTALGGLLLR
jgi:erythromycin esterase-like protein